MSAPDAPLGRIVTFYSYKGGTGRSMAMANVAWLLALKGHRVLAVDWDLEAPGLHRYFHPFLEDPHLQNTDGVLDFAIELASEVKDVKDISALPDEFFQEKGNILRLVEPLDCSRFGEDVRLDFIAAGRQGPAYSKRLSLFNWHQFYTRLGGERFLNAARDWMKSEYDYILIDSRTGVSDTSGICTVQMPSTLVICFTLNEQSIQGASAIAQSVRSQRETDEREGTFRILPVPTRVEMFSEHERRQIALEYARPFFDVYLKHLTRAQKDAYWAQVQMAYFPYYAFEEIPALFGSNPAEDISLLTSVKRVAGYITGSDPGFPDVREELRRGVLEAYQRKRTPATLAERAQTIFETLRSEQQATAREALLRLVSVSAEGGSDSAQSFAGFTAHHTNALAEFEASGIVAQRRQGSSTAWSFTNPEIVTTWTTLQKWVEQDRPFLMWRQRIDSALDSWRFSDRDEDALLRGRQLDEAVMWLETRRADLAPEELEYIALSQKAEHARGLEKIRSMQSYERFPELPPAPASKSSRWPIMAAIAAFFVIAVAVIAYKRPVSAPQNDILSLAKGAIASNNRELAALLIAEAVQRQPARAEEAASLLQQLAPLRLATWHVTGTGATVTFADSNTLIVASDTQVVRFSIADRSSHVYDGAVGPATVNGSNGFIAFARPANSFVVAKLDGAIVFPKTTASKVNTIAISPNANYFAGGTHNGTVYVQNLRGGRDARPPISGKEVMHVQFSPDSRYIAVADRSNIARVWTYNTPQVVESLAHKAQVDHIQWAPQSNPYRLVTIARDGARLWTLTDDQPKVNVLPVPDPLTAAFSPDGSLVAVSDLKGSVGVWGVNGSARLSGKISHPKYVGTLAFAPSGRVLATGSADYTVRTWDMEAGRMIFPIQLDAIVTGLAYSPDGNRLAAATNSGYVSVYHVGEPIQSTTRDALRIACQQLDRNLTQSEWNLVFPNEPYRATCPISTPAAK